MATDRRCSELAKQEQGRGGTPIECAGVASDARCLSRTHKLRKGRMRRVRQDEGPRCLSTVGVEGARQEILRSDGDTKIDD